MKATKGIFFAALGMLAAACSESKVSPDKLTYEQQEQIVGECLKTGKIATDNYCKEVAAVYGPEERRRHERARLKKELAEKPQTAGNLQQ